MVRLEPFTFEKCTAFSERKQLADKVNELVETLNNDEIFVQPETFEEYREELDGYVDTVETFDGRITEINNRYTSLNSGLARVTARTTVNENNISDITEDVGQLESTSATHGLRIDAIEDDVGTLQTDVTSLENNTIKTTGNQTVSGTISADIVYSGYHRFDFPPNKWVKLFELDALTGRRYEFTIRSIYSIDVKFNVNIYNRRVSNINVCNGTIQNDFATVDGKLAYNPTNETWELWLCTTDTNSVRDAVTIDFATKSPSFVVLVQDDPPTVGETYTIVNDLS